MTLESQRLDAQLRLSGQVEPLFCACGKPAVHVCVKGTVPVPYCARCWVVHRCGEG